LAGSDCLRCGRNDQRIRLVSPDGILSGLVEGIGRSGETGNPNPMIYVFSLSAALVQVVSVAFMMNLMGSTTAGSGALAGFIAPTNLVNKLFAGHGFKVWAIEAGNHLSIFCFSAPCSARGIRHDQI